jgi:hypothetical protein
MDLATVCTSPELCLDEMFASSGSRGGHSLRCCDGKVSRLTGVLRRLELAGKHPQTLAKVDQGLPERPLGAESLDAVLNVLRPCGAYARAPSHPVAQIDSAPDE